MLSVYMFPGQGVQLVGMGKELFAQFPGYVAIAERVLNYNVVDICLNNPEDKLNQTQYTQPALFLVEALAYLEKIKMGSELPDFVCGHSLGEYAALFAAEVISFETGLILVAERGHLMSQISGGAMIAVIGFRQDKLMDVLANNEVTDVAIANFNSATQFVLSGKAEAIHNLKNILEIAGAMVIPLKVSGAFHSPFMTEVKQKYAQILANVSFHSPRIPVISNVTACPYATADTAKLLLDQIDHSVQWEKTIHYLLTNGVEEFIECGPGNVLMGLYRKIRKDKCR